MRRLASLLFASILVCIAGCRPMDAAPDGSGVDAFVVDAGRDAPPVDAFVPDDPGPARAVFVLAPGTGGAFFDLPWPNDLRLTADGHVDTTGFTNPRSPLLDRYLRAIRREQVGFATNGAVYFRFSRTVDTSSLPDDAAASLDETSSVFLVDVDPDSATRGDRIPVTVHYQHVPSLYWSSRSVALRVLDGMPLAPDHTYAAVITSRVTATDGSAFGRDVDFAAVIDGSADTATLAVYQPALETLAADLDDVISLAVFTTEETTQLGSTLRDFVRNEYEAPHAIEGSLERRMTGAAYERIEGRFGPVPVFQSGVIPYATEGGAIDLDDGTIVEGTFDARFALTIPTTAMPADGYPLVLYSHGTGGDYESFIADGTANRLARVGYAVMGIDQIHHGARAPEGSSAPELLFFNVQNPDAVRYNTLESAIDVVSQARFAATFEIPLALVERMGAAVHFDPDGLYFFGHSQGGLVAPLFLAIDDTRGGVISAGGALIGYALLEKTEPFSIPVIFQTALGIGTDVRSSEREGLSVYHPVITLLQGWIEPSEPANYAGLVFDHPREGFAPKSVLQTEGMMDPYATPHSIEALAVALRIPQVQPVARRIETLDLLGIPAAGDTVTGNVAGGLATAGLLQYPDQGHFAVFDDATAQARIAGFFETLRAGGPGTIPPPP